jgi:hypothetical protein
METVFCGPGEDRGITVAWFSDQHCIDRYLATAKRR